MAQQQNKQNRPKQPQDPYAQQGKQLASAVQRLRGWMGSDPSRTPELADALVALTEHRLLGHAYTVAAPEAQESVKLAAQLLTANGPIGPYTSVSDAARYVTAVVHLGVIQSAAGLAEAGAETVGSLAELREELGSLPLAEALAPATKIWALSCTARGALVGGDVAEANAYADAALLRLAESGLRTEDVAAYLVVDTDRMVSDARWAAGSTDDALTHLHVARETYDRVVDGRLAQAARLAPALRERLAEPAYGLYRDLADRLLGAGEVDLGLVTRRQLVELLRGLAAKDDTARVQLAGSLTDLLRDLRAAGRDDEAALVAEELDRVPEPDRASAAELGGGVARGDGGVRWEPVGAFAAYAGAAPQGAADAATLEAELQRETTERLAAERDAARRVEGERREEARLAAERREAERLAAEQAEAERLAAEQAEVERLAAEQALAERAEAERLAAEEEAERQERKRRREERIEAHRLEQERLEAERLAAEQAEQERVEAERRAADPAEIERLELERLAAELAELERQEAAERETAELEAEARREADEAAREESDRLAEEQRVRAQAAEEQAKAEAWEAQRRDEERLEAERAEAARVEAERAAQWESERQAAEEQESERQAAEQQEAERQEAERRATEKQAAEDELTRLELERIEAERLEHERREVDPPAEPVEDEPVEDELAAAQRAWQEARGRGDRKTARAHNERVVELLRPRAEENLAEFGPKLLYALEELSSARLRSGEIFASRGPAREAKALAKALGRR